MMGKIKEVKFRWFWNLKRLKVEWWVKDIFYGWEGGWECGREG